eukprot:PhF_6_TR25161/c2_g1_i2/m.34677
MDDFVSTAPLTRLIAIKDQQPPTFLLNLKSMLQRAQSECDPDIPSDTFFEEEITKHPVSVRVILKVLGYLKHVVFLQTFVLHTCYLEISKGNTLVPALELLELLHLDKHNVAVRWDSLCRQCLMSPIVPRPTTPTAPVSWQKVSHIVEAAKFRVGFRASVAKAVENLMATAPQGSLVICPSKIPLSGYGLYIVGTLPKDTVVGIYAGAIHRTPPPGVGYCVVGPAGTFVDATVVRCLVSMMNCPRIDNARRCDLANCAFSVTSVRRDGGAGGVSQRVPIIKTSKEVSNEELYVDYGTSYLLAKNLEIWYALHVDPFGAVSER